MKRICAVLMSAAFIVVVTSGMALAYQELPNGFISGEHYNLNLLGKKGDYNCDKPDGEYGKVVFMPECMAGGDCDNSVTTNTTIEMISGKGKKAADIPDLQVIDPCTEAFDGDPAQLKLPRHDKGYYVFARALAKPRVNSDLVIVPGINWMQDDAGNDLAYLGTIPDKTNNKFQRKGGRSIALPITNLFMFVGEVCYLSDDPNYCANGVSCLPTDLCCSDPEPDSIYNDCTFKGAADCPAGYSAVAGYCGQYDDPTWVFNTADWVNYFWDINNNGIKHLQVRFYPIP